MPFLLTVLPISEIAETMPSLFSIKGKCLRSLILIYSPAENYFHD